MCVMCLKPVGVRIPSDEVFEMSFKNNPHGAGFAVADPDHARVIIKKGFWSASALRKAFLDTVSQLRRTQIGVESIFHFRYATHGSRTSGNCHPFPLSQKVEDLKATEISCKTVVAHNGAFPVCVPSLAEYSFGGLMHRREELSRYLGSNHLIIMNHDQRYLRLGNFILYRGCYWSNQTFLKVRSAA